MKYVFMAALFCTLFLGCAADREKLTYKYKVSIPTYDKHGHWDSYYCNRLEYSGNNVIMQNDDGSAWRVISPPFNVMQQN